MRTLKKEFTFNYKGQEIKVKRLGEVHCAIFGDIAKPLIIENGFIRLKEGRMSLAVLPESASWDPMDKLKQIKELLKDIEL